MSSDGEAIDEYRREIFERFNDALRKEGFSEVQIAMIDKAVRRALNM
jgi:hypothetical protein